MRKPALVTPFPISGRTAMIKQAAKEYKPAELEGRIEEFWRQTKAYEKVRQFRSRGKDFYFVDGPPYTSGTIHMGQALNKSIKDMVLRWLRMNGYNVRDQPGYDMHGLPIEVAVEKTLGITNKKEIEELGIERFVNTCRDFALDLQRKMNDQFVRLGVWMDWDRPYMTITNEWIETAWWTIRRAHDQGLLIRAEKSLQWCTRCETALAEAEVEYSDETDPSIYVKFPLTRDTGESMLAWTTTPWTLPANMAIAVHPAFTYAKVRVEREGTVEHLWMVAENVASVMNEAKVDRYEIVERMSGSRMEGWGYSQPLAQKVPFQREVRGPWVHKVVPSETVTSENTGVVHTAPGHGPEDFDLGQRLGLPIFSPIDDHGVFTADAGEYTGTPIREANDRIVSDLEAAGALFAKGTLVHRYGHCWRCNTPVAYRATTQWFLRVGDIKPRMLEEIQRVKWYPDWAGEARQYDWTLNLRDWCLSRQRYWGIPVPIWTCESCGERRVVGSLSELRTASGYREGMDLHRPSIDAITFRCSKCGGAMTRTKDTLDVWFDSGVASWSQLGYPRVTAEFQRWWPVDWIVEGPDQTRGWFSSQLMAGVVAFGRAPYDRVLMHGWVNAPDGRPMHKSLGNYVDPIETVGKFGADALRFFLLEVNAPWEDLNFIEDGVQNALRTLNILWNVHKFATTYMAIDEFDPEKRGLDSVVKHLQPEDRWLLSRLENLKIAVRNEMEQYALHRACRLLENFILDDLSRWYVKLVRSRTWRGGADEGKLAAYAVLHAALGAATRMMAPVTPFLAEEIYQNIDGRRLTVHMEDWPTVDEKWIRNDLEGSMETVQELVEVVSKARQKAQRKLRWPIRRIVVKAAPESTAKAIETFRDVLLAQTNAKELAVLGPDQEFDAVELVVVPNPAAIGRVYRQWWPKIATMLETRPAPEVKRALERGEFKIGIEGQVITIEPNMVSFEKRVPEDVAVVTSPHGEIYVDMRVTPEIEAEGYAREVVRRIQQMRKEVDLDVDDYIRVTVKVRKEFANLLEPWKEFVASETRARTLVLGEEASKEERVVEWTVEGETFVIGITPLHMTEALREFTKVPRITERTAIALYDAGYRSVVALRAATKDELARVEGLDGSDVRRIREFAETGGTDVSIRCTTCGAAVPEQAAKCERCGESVAREIPCPNCGTRVTAGAERCPSCGHRFVQTTAFAAQEGDGAASETGGPASPGVESAVALRPSSTYLALEHDPARSYGLFRDALTDKRPGFCVTRTYPNKVREQHSLADVEILWLSNVGKESSVRPKDLEKLSLSLEQFITREQGGVVLIDGLEYLITNNNFLTVLRLVQALRDLVAIHHATLLFSVDPGTLDAHQKSLLEREVDTVLPLPT